MRQAVVGRAPRHPRLLSPDINSVRRVGYKTRESFANFDWPHADTGVTSSCLLLGFHAYPAERQRTRPACTDCCQMQVLCMTHLESFRLEGTTIGIESRTDNLMVFPRAVRCHDANEVRVFGSLIGSSLCLRWLWAILPQTITGKGRIVDTGLEQR